MLALILLFMNMVEWCTFLASTITSTEAQAIGNHDTIAGEGPGSSFKGRIPCDRQT